MLVAFTSRRGSAGKTTLAVACASVLSQKTNLKICLVDLSFNNDIKSLYKIHLNDSRSIDKLIYSGNLCRNNKYVRENIIPVGNLDLLTGTRYKKPDYLSKKVPKIANVLDILEEMYDLVLLDTIESVYYGLIAENFDLVTFNILMQSQFNLNNYKRDIKEQDFDGYYVLNSYRPSVIPSYEDLSRKVFDGNLLKVSHDEMLQTTMNTYNTSYFYKIKSDVRQDIQRICSVILNECGISSKELEENYHNINKKKKGFFAKIFGR